MYQTSVMNETNEFRLIKRLLLYYIEQLNRTILRKKALFSVCLNFETILFSHNRTIIAP